LGDTLRMVITLTAPATVGLLLLGRPLIEFVYQRGAFDPQATSAVYTALAFYALGLVGHSSLELVARTFFALRDTVTPLLVAAAAGLCQVLLALLLMRWLDHGGLALANSVAISLEVLALLVILRRRLGAIEGRQTLWLCGRVGLACLAMGLGVWAALWLFTQLALPAPAALLLLLGGTAVGALVYVVAGLLLKIPTLQRLPTYFFARG
jgi:putative peptidoglycan lipid II flippase